MAARSRLESRRSRAVSRYLAASATVQLGESDPSTDPASPFRPVRLKALLVPPAAQAPHLPDLLHDEAALALDPHSLNRLLGFAFLSGDAAGAAWGALDQAAYAPSDHDPNDFVAALFLKDLVAKCFVFQSNGRPAPVHKEHLERLLAQPPRSAATTAYRQAIQAELSANAALPSALGQVYHHLLSLIRLLEDNGKTSRAALPRYRLDVLQALHRTIESMANPFQNTVSGLHRLHAFAHYAQSSPGYKDLQALLAFENELSSVQLQVQIGADGRIRNLQLQRVAEAEHNPFYVPPWKRWLQRIALWLRGYRLGETELVDRWLDQVFAGVSHLLPPLLQLRGDLEFYLGSQHFRQLAEQANLPLCLPRFAAPEAGGLHLEGLFNPLLLDGSLPPIPCDLQLSGTLRTTIITGPNSGGKTRLLQALGLCQLLAQAGSYAPAKDGLLGRAQGLFVSLGEATHVDQSEGRLGTELLRIRRLFEQARRGSLVLLDELCSGTNPSEGEEIFRLVIELLNELRPQVFITTHFLQFAATLAEPQGSTLPLNFLQVELDADDQPTYRFVPGVATTSLANRTAERLGVTREHLLALIRRT